MFIPRYLVRVFPSVHRYVNFRLLFRHRELNVMAINDPMRVRLFITIYTMQGTTFFQRNPSHPSVNQTTTTSKISIRVFQQLPYGASGILRLYPRFNRRLFMKPRLFLAGTQVYRFSNKASGVSILVRRIQRRFQIESQVSKSGVRISTGTRLQVVLSGKYYILTFQRVCGRPNVPSSAIFGYVRGTANRAANGSMIIQLHRRFRFSLSLLGVGAERKEYFTDLPSPSRFCEVPADRDEVRPPVVVGVDLAKIEPFYETL